MPSDSKKKRDAKKKEAAKSRGQKKVSKQDGDLDPDVNEAEESELNGEDLNGTPGTCKWLTFFSVNEVWS